ncbi:MAG: hypothetical protein LBV28_06085 [Puniceicoccales bacterium]|jgi:hypothetical protein|nr:hypothetical protein [Puniceicoccales bacterium]
MSAPARQAFRRHRWRNGATAPIAAAPRELRIGAVGTDILLFSSGRSFIVRAMNAFFSELKALSAQATHLSFGGIGFFLATAVALVALYFASAWILKKIFEREVGRVKPFAVVLLALAEVALCAAASGAWVGPPHVSFEVAGVLQIIAAVLGGAAGVVTTKFFLKIKTRSAIGFLLLNVLVAWVVLRGVGAVYLSFANALPPPSV